MKKVLLLILAVCLAAGSTLAKSSAELRKELDALKAQADALQEQGETLEEELNRNAADTRNVVDRKYDIDRKIRQTELEIENVAGQILQYSLLIAEKQKDLEAAQRDYEVKYEQYKTRLRAMEERESSIKRSETGICAAVAGSKSDKFIRTYFDAFHNFVSSFDPRLTSSSLYRISVPIGAVAIQYLNASVPNFSTVSSGSVPLPLVLDIF